MVKSIMKVYCAECQSNLEKHGSMNNEVKLRCPECKYSIWMELVLV